MGDNLSDKNILDQHFSVNYVMTPNGRRRKGRLLVYAMDQLKNSEHRKKSAENCKFKEKWKSFFL